MTATLERPAAPINPALVKNNPNSAHSQIAAAQQIQLPTSGFVVGSATTAA